MCKLILIYPAETESDKALPSVLLEPGQPAYICSDQALYIGLTLTSSSHLDIPKNNNGQFRKWKVD